MLPDQERADEPPAYPPRIAEYEQTKSIGKLAAALTAAQAELGNAAKDSSNPHFNSKYADLASIRDATKPIYAHGLSVVQQVLSTPDGLIGLRTVLMHTSGEWIASLAYMKPERTGPQAAGSVITYLRRYMLAAVLGIAQEDDDGNAASAPPPARRPGPRAVPPPQPPDAREAGADDDEPGRYMKTLEDVRGLLLKAAPHGLHMAPKHAEAWLKKYFGKGRPLDLSQAQADDAYLLLSRRLRQNELYPSMLEQFFAERRILTDDPGSAK